MFPRVKLNLSSPILSLVIHWCNSVELTLIFTALHRRTKIASKDVNKAAGNSSIHL